MTFCALSETKGMDINMKKYCKFMLCLSFCFILFGCRKSNNISPTSSAIQDIPTSTLDATYEELESIEQNSFKNIKAVKDNKLNMEDGMQELLQSSNKKYTIEDMKYEQEEHKGKFNVKYPVLRSDEKDMNVVNSVILAKVVDELYYEDTETTIDIDLDYEIKHANDAFISILFTGFYNAHGAAHPNNISFTINFDLNHNRPLSLYDVIILEDNMLEKVHGAMESQLEKEGVEAFEKLSVDELNEQIYDKNEGFYIQNGKIYIRFSITAGAEYHEYISFII